MSQPSSLPVIGVPRETFPGERRVALVPDVVATLVKKGFNILIESGAGTEAGITDQAFINKGAEIISDRSDLYARAGIILQVRGAGANPDRGPRDLESIRPGQIHIGLYEPFTRETVVSDMAARGAIMFAMELMPRITRAQSMDVLSSMATVAGYKAVLLAAGQLPRMFPMFMTAAGTIAPARVFVIGAGVAGLQAIATAKRLGAVVKGYDIRPVVKEQVESLGARFVELELDAADAEDKGGYARAMDEDFYRRQRELLTRVVAASDVVLTTAAVPGKKAPVLITAEMVRDMSPGSIIIDLAAERGGNVELTRPGETVVEQGVTIVGPLNLTASVPFHASQMYAKNIATFLMHLVKDDGLTLDMDDEITRETLMARDGEIVHPRLIEIYGPTDTPDGERRQP